MAKIVSSSAHDRLVTAVTAHRAGRLDEAETIYREILSRTPLNVDAAYNLAVLLVNSDRSAEALNWADRGLTEQATAARLHNVRGMALGATGQWPLAVVAYEAAVRLEPGLAEAQGNLSLALRQTGEITRAIEVAERAATLDPKSADAFNNLGNALDEAGEAAGAEAAYAQAVALRADFAIAWHNYANAHRFTEGDPALAQLAAVPAPSDEGKSWLLFARAKAAGDLGHFEKASKLYRSANELMRVRSRFDFAGHGQMLQGMKIGFSGMAPPPASVGSDHHPIMILGASRAGKSLVERLLADGRDAVAFGEHLTWQGALAAAGVGEVALRPLLPEVGAKVAAAYLSKVTARAPEAKVSLGTSPGNLMFAGMFLEALPEGRVVWVRRALRDQVLRIYFKRYNAGNGFAYDFGDITRFLAQFDDMMTHWKMRYGARVIEVRYEDLVTDAAAALAPLGLPVRDLRLSADEIGRWRDYAPFWSDFATLGVA